MMHVKIDDSNSLNRVSVPSFGVCCRHCDIVDEAESVRLRLIIALVISMESLTEHSSMVARRSGGTESIPELSLRYFVDGLDDSSTS